MGRLTLNVLLSFAQFEREATGERIRDKIAASKRKGMWMGGMVPLGYDLHDRSLVPNESEAERVREIYRLYLQLGCVSKLQCRLDAAGIRSKKRLSKTGKLVRKRCLFSGLALRVASEPALSGRDQTQGEDIFAGKHSGVIDRGIWDRVQQQLATNRPVRRRQGRPLESGLLTGILFDGEGNRLTPSHTTKKGRRSYYYVPQALIDTH